MWSVNKLQLSCLIHDAKVRQETELNKLFCDITV